MTAPTPSQDQIQQVLRSFLQGVLPFGVEVFEGQDNRVPEPAGLDFVVMTAIFRRRISTNIDTYQDCRFTGSIAAGVMTVTLVSFGTILNGATVFGVGITDNTIITSFGSGIGGVGTYNVNPQQNVPSEVLATGAKTFTAATEIVFQLDVHGPNAADNAQTISTFFRDAFAVDFFSNSGLDVAPLHADDPRQVPFLNAEQQYETRWIVEARVQANQVVSQPQQFADSVVVGLKEVDTTFPP